MMRLAIKTRVHGKTKQCLEKQSVVLEVFKTS
ncbi:hypothetical protein F441_07997 [Phytophthora nicotianae CJ01A1]|uniref:Uncharacterized protein n=4 Tax=Phytophthora nicotianae TaxID=4792 RepID=V9F8B9_PHYNI|nr:hypothetical protein F443_08031 [Phytophthora nicotianae P1569]ETL28754.1 hypothetical protein L916_17948 [Phytophthora nicotianae]ETP17594.1 hypothetical protein F441_07997 [Phytophthora nicotianae CJ01A1]ETP45625.1 hypothetical protein F442_07964 [Phytophthora nicotianae P10297]